MGNATEQVEDVIRRAMMHDYFEDFTTRFEFAATVREKQTPLTAVDEIRNVIDHFAKAQIAAAIFDGQTVDIELPPDHLPVLNDPRHILDAHRGVRHIASATYFTRHFAAAWIMEDIVSIMNTDLARNSPDFDDFSERYATATKKFADVDRPGDDRYNVLDVLKKVIDDTWGLVVKLDEVVLLLDDLYRDICVQMGPPL
jgi:hypothetical protein